MSTDLDLLFGVLALQEGFIDRTAFVAACAAWAADPARPLAEVLTEHGQLDGVGRARVQAMVERRLDRPGGSHEGLAVQRGPAVLASTSDPSDPAAEYSITRIDPRPSEFPLQDHHLAPDAASNPAEPPRVALDERSIVLVGRYHLEREYGKGGMGTVWVAYDTALHREVVLKEIHPDVHASATDQARFMREAQIAGQLQHPAIVPVYGLGRRGDGRPFYIMKFVRGVPLSRTIRQFHRDFPPGRESLLDGPARVAFRILLNHFIAVCEAIGYAHRCGVIHRDLKPSNVMIGDYGETQLIDWGLAKVRAAPDDEALDRAGPGQVRTAPPPAVTLDPETQADATRAGQVKGTASYMAPEQAAGRADQADARTDIYGLGAILYVILAGRPPTFQGDPAVPQSDRSAAQLEAVQTRPPVRPRAIRADVPRPLEAICLKALAKRPADRYPDALALAEEIRKVLADEPVDAWREPWTVRARRRIMQHRTLVAGGVAAILVAALSLAIATALLSQANQRSRFAAAWQAIARRRAEREGKEAREERDQAQAQREKAERSFRLARATVDRYSSQIGESRVLNQPGLRALRKELLETALEFYRKSAEERGDDPSIRVDLGRGLRRLAKITGEIEARPRPIRIGQEAVATLEDLVRDDPGVAEYQTELAWSLATLGRLYAAMGRTSRAETVLHQAQAIHAQLAQDHPEDPRRAVELAGSYSELGDLLRDLGRPGDSLAWYHRAIRTLKDVLRREGRDTAARQLLRDTYGDRAGALSRLGRYAEALGDWDRAIELDPGSDRPMLRIARAITLARLGDHARAVAEADALRGDPLATAVMLVALARVYCLASAAALHDARRSAADRQRLADRYAARALDLLSRDQAAGWLKEPANRAKLESDPELAPIRGQPGFAGLMAKLRDRGPHPSKSSP